ncbi:hypothetical protein DsansV1_C23g0174401 [Dioscorea sansibarensis]
MLPLYFVWFVMQFSPIISCGSIEWHGLSALIFCSVSELVSYLLYVSLGFFWLIFMVSYVCYLSLLSLVSVFVYCHLGFPC